MKIIQGNQGKSTGQTYNYLCLPDNKRVAAYSIESWKKVNGFQKFVCWLLGKTTEVEVNNERYVVIKGSFRKAFGGFVITDKDVYETLKRVTGGEVHAPTSKANLLKTTDVKKELEKNHVPPKEQERVLNNLNRDKPINQDQMPRAVDPKAVQKAVDELDHDFEEPSITSWYTGQEDEDMPPLSMQPQILEARDAVVRMRGGRKIDWSKPQKTLYAIKEAAKNVRTAEERTKFIRDIETLGYHVTKQDKNGKILDITKRW